ncbi:acyl-CoA dehydrogenase family protein [Actinomadura oligospora]|uniref:acyl-CoA dehydrogenase family protein n=1 Tax=Actinomadura oligospora TaxID=111804 RepID=UPI0004B94A4B|nr:acyl-CoA dehydrogenase family protein [Actinomadura oligospora]
MTGAPAATRERTDPVAALEAFLTERSDTADTAATERSDVFSAERAGELDRDEELPAEACALLDAFGLPAYYVPVGAGGRLDDHEVLFRLLRTVAAHDLTVAVAHGKTYLGAVPVWIAGTPEQARSLGARVAAGARVSWALTEPEHGADLLANEVSATPAEGGGHRLDGTKWPLNNATAGSHLCVLARTDDSGGPRGHSLFLVDKADLPDGSYRLLPKARTHGIRGADISGIAFDGALLPATAMVGREGGGIETVLLGLQLTRTVCASLSAGAAEHALRLAAGFAAERLIQGRPLVERPNVRAVLTRAAAALTAVEAAGIVGARAAHGLTGEMSVVSAVVKALAPTLTDRMLGELAELLGSRAFLTREYASGAFQKIQRDHQVVGIFDGSTIVNRNGLINQFPRLVRAYAAGTADAEGLAVTARAGTPPGELDWARLSLVSRTGCSVVQGVRAAVAQLEGSAESQSLLPLAREVLAATDAVHVRMVAVGPSARPDIAAFEVAADYELCFAAAACLHLWAAGAAHGTPDGALWLRITLRHLLAELGRAPDPDPSDDERIAGLLTRAVADGAPLSPLHGRKGGPS